LSSISVVIPCYNAEDYVGEALASVRAQTRRPLEVLAIDDGSTDGTADVVGTFEEVRLLRNPVNMGNALVRNRALFEAKGELIAFLDADDVWLPHHLETVAGLLDRFPGAAVGCSGVEFFGSREGHWRPRLPEATPADAFWECLRATGVPQMTAVVRAAVFAAVGGYQQPSPPYRSAPDYDLWLRIARHHPFVATREITARYRWHPKQISQTSNDEQVAAVYHSRWLMLHELEQDAGDDRRDRVEEKVHRYWNEDYRAAFRERDEERMQLLDGIRVRLFPALRRPPGLWLRSAVPMPVLRGLDAWRDGDGAGAEP
jgi:glycosyltransferase involved in cell wall biosynthesis